MTPWDPPNSLHSKPRTEYTRNIGSITPPITKTALTAILMLKFVTKVVTGCPIFPAYLTQGESELPEGSHFSQWDKRSKYGPGLKTHQSMSSAVATRADLQETSIGQYLYLPNRLAYKRACIQRNRSLNSYWNPAGKARRILRILIIIGWWSTSLWGTGSALIQVYGRGKVWK